MFSYVVVQQKEYVLLVVVQISPQCQHRPVFVFHNILTKLENLLCLNNSPFQHKTVKRIASSVSC